jgi:Ca2+/Na+ antiporter
VIEFRLVVFIMKYIRKNNFIHIFSLLFASAILKYIFTPIITDGTNIWLKLVTILVIMAIGAGFVLKECANIIEETTDILAKKTKLAGGLLQSFGTAFPDMALGVMAAIISLRLMSTDYALAVNFAIIAAATTFGSNIYNIAHAIWCVMRQNMADSKSKEIFMFPFIRKGGMVKPLMEHLQKPHLTEIDTALNVLNALTILTATVAITMVLFGRVDSPPPMVRGDLYQLIRPVGVVIFLLCILVMYIFRKTKRPENPNEKVAEEEKSYGEKPILFVWINLFVSGIAILFAAESMVEAVRVFCDITGIPFVLAGVLAGVIGCLGEILVVHNYSIHPKGRIADALTGVAMDNIVTTMGASIVAIMGGIFLGGNALILIFVIILTLNTVLIWQISRLKNSLFKYLIAG